MAVESEGLARIEKGGQRDHGQVLANGGTAALFALIAVTCPHRLSSAALCAMVASLCEASADTWATEIGAASGVEPRLITTWKPVAAGQSGGVTIPGTVSALVGSAFVAVSAIPLLRQAENFVVDIIVCLCSGFVFSLLDSVLGATLQSRYISATGRIAEVKSEDTMEIRGLAWLNNDLVNVISTVAAALFCGAIALL